MAVVTDESKLAEFVHESANAGSGGADHLRQCFLTDIHQNRLRAAFLSEMRKQKEKARESLLARIKLLVDQVFFNSAVACQEIRHEQLGKLWFLMKERNHRFLRYRSDHAIFHRRCGRDPQRMSVKAAFAEELASF